MAKKKVVVKKTSKGNPLQPTNFDKTDNKKATDIMAPTSGREPASIPTARTGGNPQSRTVKVKSNKQLKTKDVKASGKGQPSAKAPTSNAHPTAATGGATTMLTANTTPMVGQLSATFAPNPNLSALGEVTVGESNDAATGNIYDERIGGFGTAARNPNGKWEETGEQAVKRIAKVKVKKPSNSKTDKK